MFRDANVNCPPCMNAGYYMLFFLAGLEAIPPEAVC
jgi:hypothetical protein